MLTADILSLSSLVIFKQSFIRHDQGHSAEIYLYECFLLIYLLHENVFMSAYYRPEFIRSICQNYGYDHILLIVLAASTGIYLFFAACAWLIQRALHSPMRRISDRLYTGLRQIFGRSILIILNIHRQYQFLLRKSEV